MQRTGRLGMIGLSMLMLLFSRGAGAQACDDGSLCTTNACQAGICAITSAVTCPPDANVCTVESCDPSTGGCISTPLSCDDGNPCTIDACDPSTGCSHTALAPGTACDDFNACTQNDVCGVDPPGPTPPQCSGTPVTNGASCGPTNSCFSFVCQTGFCTVHLLIACPSDNNACTTEFCNPTMPAGQECQSFPVSCDDGETCTTDSCDTVKGCVSVPLTGPSCDDGNSCTANDSCVSGVCNGEIASVASPTPTVTPSSTPSETPTLSPTQTPSISPPLVATGTPSVTQTASVSAAPATSTATLTASSTATPSRTATITQTTTPSSSPTASPSATQTGTASASPTTSPTTTPTTSPTTVPPVLQVQPPVAHDFGAILPGGSSSFTYIAGNIGGGVLIGTAATPCTGFGVAPTDINLTPGGTVPLVVTFTPPGPGTFNCQLIINTNGGSVAIDLTGGGREAAPIPMIGSPTAPAGLVMIGLFVTASAWALRRRRIKACKA